MNKKKKKETYERKTRRKSTSEANIDTYQIVFIHVSHHVHNGNFQLDLESLLPDLAHVEVQKIQLRIVKKPGVR